MKRVEQTVSVEHEGKRYPIFHVGYDKSGGFFISDLAGKGNHWVAKVRYPRPLQDKPGPHFLPMVERWYTAQNPKLTHHVNGNVHISNNGITSGFFAFSGKPKGMGTKSFSLTKCDHDGGPQMSFVVWGLEQFATPSDEDGVCFSDGDQFDNPRDPPVKDKAFAIEAFYLPKAPLGPHTAQERLNFRYKGLNIVVPMLFVPAPEHSPGVLGLVCHRFGRGSTRLKYGIMFGGGASKTANGEVEQLHIAYPANEMLGERYQMDLPSLDFQGSLKVKTLVRDKVEKILNWLFHGPR